MADTGQAGRRWFPGAAGLALALGLAACEAPEVAIEVTQTEAPMTEPVAEAPADAVAEADSASPASVDEDSAPPPAAADAPESVQPESETLFY